MYNGENMVLMESEDARQQKEAERNERGMTAGHGMCVCVRNGCARRQSLDSNRPNQVRAAYSR